MSCEPNYSTLCKKSVEEYYVGFNLIAPDLASGETITNVSVTVDPAGLTLSGAPTISGNTVSQLVTGGASGISYVVTFNTTTSAGNLFSDDRKVKIL